MDTTGAFTSPIIYPVCQVQNPKADDAECAAAVVFLNYLQSLEALAIFRTILLCCPLTKRGYPPGSPFPAVYGDRKAYGNHLEYCPDL